MKNKHNKLTCLFGHHQYSKKLTKDKHSKRPVYLCKICKRSGCYKYADGKEVWYDYDEEGNCLHTKWKNGDNVWFNKKGVRIHEKWVGGNEIWYYGDGNVIHVKWNDGRESWKDNNGQWVDEKPKNWIHEKDLQ